MNSIRGLLSKAQQAVREPRYALYHLSGIAWMWYYRLRSNSYPEATRRYMNRQVRKHPKRAIGGWETGIGELQFQFLRDQGLTPEDRMLDIGCGTLRGGRYFIDYLDAGNYYGMDISEAAIEAGQDLIDEDLLAEKDPTLLVNSDLRFAEFDRQFEYILGQSLLTHLQHEQIEECFSHLHRVLNRDGEAYFTYLDVSDRGPRWFEPYDYTYSFSDLRAIAAAHGLDIERIGPEIYDHPRGQRMIEIQLDSGKPEGSE